MDLDLSEEQKMLQTSARDFLSNECPKDKVRELEESEEGYSPEMWKHMAELGWMGLIFPEECEGTEGEFLDLIVLLEEMGRNILPSPFFSTVVLCALPILEFGNDGQKKEFLTRIATGQLIMAFALTEPSASYNASGINVKAVLKGDQYTIDGAKLFVNDANVADWLLVACRTTEAKKPVARGEPRLRREDGVTLFLVDAKSPGIKVEVVPTTALDKQCEVVFDGLKVPKANILGEVDKGWKIVSWILERAAVCKCAEMLGGCEAALEIANSYAKERIVYKRPIADFQVIQHYLVNMWMMTQTSRNIAYEAAWMAGEGIPCVKEVSAAKAWVSEAFKFVTERGVEVQGAVGTTREYDMGLYYRRAWAWDVMFGDANFHREIVAKHIGL